MLTRRKLRCREGRTAVVTSVILYYLQGCERFPCSRDLCVQILVHTFCFKESCSVARILTLLGDSVDSVLWRFWRPQIVELYFK